MADGFQCLSKLKKSGQRRVPSWLAMSWDSLVLFMSSTMKGESMSEI